MTPEKREQLLDKFFQNQLSKEESSQLKQTLRNGGQEADDFLDQLYQQQLMVYVGNGLQKSRVLTPITKAKPIRLWPIAAAALLTLGCYFILLYVLEQNKPEEYKPILAKWVKLSDNQHVVAQTKQYMYSGKQRLPEGNFQLIFSNGTKVNLNQNAEFDLIDQENMVLYYGNLLAVVSEEASQLRVKTPGADIIDIGTTYGVQVDEQQNSTIYVKKGLVSVTSPHHNQKQLLRLNEQIHVENDGGFSNKSLYREPIQEVIPDIQNTPDRPHLKWKHWNFENDFITEDSSQKEAHPFQKNPNALPKVCESPFGKGIRFDGIDDGLSSPHFENSIATERSMSFYLRLPQDVSHSNDAILFNLGKSLSDQWSIAINHQAHEGELHAMKVKTQSGYITAQSPLQDGRWHHVAIVFLEGETSNLGEHVLIYIDGKLESHSDYRPSQVEQSIPSQQKDLHIGYAPDSDVFFKGDLDEIWIFEQALWPDEILRLRDRNSPFQAKP